MPAHWKPESESRRGTRPTAKAAPLCALGLLFALALTGCPGSQKDGRQPSAERPAASGGTLTLPLTVSPQDPALGQSDFSDPRLWALARAVSLPLTRATSLGEAQPGLATAWAANADCTAWEFTLSREPAAKDAGAQYLAFLKQLLRSGDPAIRAQLMDLVQGAADFAKGRAEDVAGLALADGSLTFQLTRPVVELPLWLSQPGLALGVRLPDRPHGYGPFQLGAASAGRIELTPNPASLAGPPRLDKLVFVCEPDRAAQVELFRQQQLDAANIPTLDVAAIAADETLAGSLNQLTTAGLLRASFDHGQFPWGDEQFKSKQGLRAGVNLVLDKEQLAALLNDQIVPWPHCLPRNLQEFLDPAARSNPAFPIGAQIEPAREAIKAAGHEQGINLPRGMDLAYLSGEDLDVAADQILEYFNEITVLMRPFSLTSDELRQRVDAGTQEMCLERFNPAYPSADAYFYPSLFGPVNAERGSPCRLRNRAFDKLLAQAQAEPDAIARRKAYQQLSAEVEGQALFLFAGELSPSILVSPAVAGMALTPYDFDASLPFQDFSKLGRSQR